MPRIKNGDLLVEARGLLHGIWQRCLSAGFIGRCYSKHRGHSSPIPGSNIILYDGEELVVVWQEDMTGPVSTATFVRSKDRGRLEEEVRAVLSPVIKSQDSSG
jgi:hypothetical protein